MQTTTSTYQNRGNFYLSSTNSVLNACRSYELSNHLGNVLSVISDKVIPHQNGSTVDYFLADIRQSTDYSPFGVTLEGRNLTASGADGFRYGFNGMEADDEIKNEGNSYDFGARMYDPRLGRWLTIDPQANNYSPISTYAYAANSPIQFADPNGEEIIVTITDNGNGDYSIQVQCKIYVIGSGVTENFIKSLNDRMDDVGVYEDGTASVEVMVNGKATMVTASISYDIQIIDASKEHNVNNQNGIPSFVVQQNNQTDEQWLSPEVPRLAPQTAGRLEDGENVMRVFDTDIAISNVRNLFNYGMVFNGEPILDGSGNPIPNQAIVYSNSQKVFTFIHEIGHFLGFKDQYSIINKNGKQVSVPNKGYETDILGKGTNEGLTFSQNHYNSTALIFINRFLQGEKTKNIESGKNEVKTTYNGVGIE